MIINLKKYLFIGAKDEIDEFFHRAQQNGFLEFISVSGKKTFELPARVQQLITALKIIRKLPVKKNYQGLQDLHLAHKTGERVIFLKAEIERLMEERRLIEAEISRVEPFGDFSLEDIDFIEKEGKRKIQFFCMKTAKSHKTNFTGEVIYIGTEYDLDYFITINKEYTTYPDMIEMRIDRPVGELRLHLQIVKEKIVDSETELKNYAGHIQFLHEALIEELNQFHLQSAKKEVEFPFGESVFAIEAWVPENKTIQLFGLLDALAVHAEEIAIEEIDRVPTCMENKGVNKLGEDLVKIYDIPAITDKDPSGWVLWAFALFFAMIVADGGYGLIYLAIALLIKLKFPHLIEKGRRGFRLLVLLGISCVVWGFISCSFFGLKFAPDSPFAKISLVRYLAQKKAEYHIEQKDDVHQEWVKKFPQVADIKEGKLFLQIAAEKKDLSTTYQALDKFADNILLEFSLLIGVIHLSLSLLRYFFRNWAAIGWVAFLVGGYFYFPSMLNATSLVHFLGWIDKQTATIVGLQLIYGGIGAALFLALIQKRWKGLGEIANLIQVFADTLSYLRLYALGLAGGIMASTFNEIGGVLGFALGAVIIIVGQGINLLLASMGGVIHGLRLNFLEWYHYSFDGGGKLFNPLRKFKT
jgi:V/A-type H+-transporting ATPase subunit I